MKTIITSLLMTFALLAPQTIFADDPITETRKMQPFSAISVSGAYLVDFTQGSGYSVTIVADKQSGIDKTITTVEDGKLTIKPDGIKIGLTIHITAPSLKNIDLNGAAKFECKETLKGNIMDISLNGTGFMSLKDVSCKEFKIVQFGTSSSSINGTVTCTTFDSEVNGAGGAYIENVVCTTLTSKVQGAGGSKIGQSKATNATFVLSGAGKITAENVNIGTIDAQINGIGQIVLTGKAKKINKSVQGIGGIKTKNLIIG